MQCLCSNTIFITLAVCFDKSHRILLRIRLFKSKILLKWLTHRCMVQTNQNDNCKKTVLQTVKLYTSHCCAKLPADLASCFIKNGCFTGKYGTLCCYFKPNKLVGFASSDPPLTISQLDRACFLIQRLFISTFLTSQQNRTHSSHC